MSTAEVTEILAAVDRRRWMSSGAFAWFWSHVAQWVALEMSEGWHDLYWARTEGAPAERFARFWQEVALCLTLTYVHQQLPAWIDLRSDLRDGDRGHWVDAC